MGTSRSARALVNAVIIVLLLVGQGSIQHVQAQEIGPTAEQEPQPELLKDIYTANASSNPRDFFVVGDQIFYTAEDSEHGRELWVSDGTVDGTHMVEDINPNLIDDNWPESSNPTNFILFREKLYFSANHYTWPTSSGIWYSDGTPGGTDVAYETGDGHSISLAGVAGDWLYFTRDYGALGRYGGSNNEVEWIFLDGFDPSCWPDDVMAMIDGILYFSAAGDSLGYELWRWDSVSGQVSLVKDIESNSGSSAPNYLTVVGNKLFFSATTEANGTELWVSDGTEDGTHLVKDIVSGPGSPAFKSGIGVSALGGWFYFVIDDGVHGRELWRSDGTEANTTLIADLALGPVSADPEHLTAVEYEGNWTVFFSARDGAVDEGHGIELWAVPVTVAGVPSSPVLLEIEPGTAGSLPNSFMSEWYSTAFAVIGNKIYLSAYDSAGGFELWESDGTPAGTARLVDGIPGPDGCAPTELAVWGSRLVYSAVDAQHGRELWTSSTTAGTAQMIVDAVTTPVPGGSGPHAGLVVNMGGANIRYFTAEDPLHGQELWRSDGTSEGTWLVKDIFPGPEMGTSVLDKEHSAVIDGILYFGASDNFSEYLTVWRTDGTSEGTWKLQNPDPGQKYYATTYMAAAGSTLFFMTFTNTNPMDTQLWKSDGTREGTELVETLVTDCNCVEPLYALGENVIFTMNWSLWRSDGTETGTQPYYDLTPFTGGYAPMSDVVVFENKLYFNGKAGEGTNHLILWVTDGTTGGTTQLQSGDGMVFGSPVMFTEAGGDLYFAAQKYDGVGSRLAVSLWVIPSGGAAVHHVMDLISADIQYSSSPRFLAMLENGKWMFLDEDEYDPIHPFLWYVADPITGVSARLCHALACYPEFVFGAAAWQGAVFFSANEEGWSGSAYETYVLESNGTAEGTFVITDPGANTPLTFGREFLSSPNAFYFSANDGVHGVEPWVIRSTRLDEKIYLPVVRKQ